MFLSKRKTVLIIVGILLNTFLSAMDSTIVSIAMPKIVGDLQGMAMYMWPFAAYLLSSTVISPIAGKLSDLFGRKPVYLAGIVTFMAASVLCGFAGSMVELSLFRAVQGLGGGAIVTVCSIMIGDIFAPAERGRYQGLSMGAYALATVIGPFLGGLLTDYLSWRWIFYINLPFGIAALLLLFLCLPKQGAKRDKVPIDYKGMIVFAIAMIPLLLAFSWAGSSYPWDSWQVISLLVLSAALAVLFIFIERKAKAPIMPVYLFKNAVFDITIALGFLATAAMFGTITYLPLFVQDVIGSNATASGAVTVPMMIAMLITSAVNGQIVSRTARYKLSVMIGFLIAVAGMVVLATLDAYSTNTVVVIGMVVLGAGIGMSLPVTSVVIQSVFPHDKLSFATSTMSVFRNIGGALSTAVLGSVLTSSLGSRLQSIGTENMSVLKAFTGNAQSLTDPRVMDALKGSMPSDIFSRFAMQVKMAVASSVHEVFIIIAVILVVAFIATLFWKRITLRKKNVQNGEISQE